MRHRAVVESPRGLGLQGHVAGGELVVTGARPIVRRMAGILGGSRWLTFASAHPSPGAMGGAA